MMSIVFWKDGTRPIDKLMNLKNTYTPGTLFAFKKLRNNIENQYSCWIRDKIAKFRTWSYCHVLHGHYFDALLFSPCFTCSIYVLRLLHTRVTSTKYFEKRKFFNPDEACIFFKSFDAIYMQTYFNEIVSRLNYL